MFVLGTDAVGRDILSRLIYGSRYSLFIGFVVVSFSLVSGVILGLLAGYFRGWVDTLIMRIMDIILAFPSLLLALVLVAILGPGLFNAMLAIALVLQPHFARLTRAAVMAEKNREYVVSAKVAGAGHLRLMLVTILPNCVAPLIVQATLSFSNAILEAAALGFLGQGAQPPTPEWGTMLANAREFVTAAPWIVTYPGPRYPHHRACHQSGRRRPSRCARSEVEEVVKNMPLLDIKNLVVSFDTSTGPFLAVRGIDISVEKREVLAIVGESGSGKSVSMLAVMGLLPDSATVTADKMEFDGIDLLKLNPSERRKIIGKDIAMIFQEPMASLNPCFTVGFQIEEVLRFHMGMDKAQRRARAIELLTLVGIPQPEERLSSFPHQMSGGQCQRVMIAMAIACNPKLLIADEPTTALDVTIQKQILDLLVGLQAKYGMGLIMITHNMGVVAETADRVVVQYKGRKMEEADVLSLFESPKSNYTRALLSALPENAVGDRLPTVSDMLFEPADSGAAS